MNRAELKRQARAQLGDSIFGGNWPLSIVVVLIFSAIMSVSSYVPALPILILGPLSVGFIEVFKVIKREGIVKIEGLFSGFTKDFKNTLILGILMNIFIALWSLLFVIPGIVKAYAYSMAFYLKSEHEDWDWRRCLDESQKLTKGHKMELFILDLSFIGWYIVGALCLGIGTLWVEAYRHQTVVNYYEELTSVRVEG